MRNDTHYNGLFFACAALAVVIVFFISSCNTEGKFVKFHDKHNTAAAGHCAIWYPPKDSTIIKEVIKQGPTVYVPGPKEYVNCDSIIAINKQNEAHGLPDIDQSHVACPPCPPSTHTIDTFFSIEDHYIENTAKVVSLQGQLAQSNKERDNYQADYKRWKKYAKYAGGSLLILILLAIAYFYIKLRSRV